MFKVRKLKIGGIGPFRKNNPATFHFGPFFTLLRGQSGSGKTTVLSTLALLGHACVMRFEAAEADRPDPLWDRYAEFDLVVGPCKLGDDRSLKRLAGLWQELLGENQAVELKVWIRLPHDADNRDENLDTILSRESLLERCFISGRPDHIEFLQALVEFSRPRQKLSLEKSRVQKLQAYLGQSVSKAPGNLAKEICDLIASARPEFESPPRSALLSDPSIALPPLISYFNTDVHQGGLGLDIRESPKRLTDDLADLLCRRLQVVDEHGRVANDRDVRAFWSDVLGTPEGMRRGSALLVKTGAGKDAQVAIVEEEPDEILLEPGSPQARKIMREFVSSGENQILFLALIFGTLRPAHSLLMLDEPDLHMSLPTAMRMYNQIHERAIRLDMQVITASHLSFVFPETLHPAGALQALEPFLSIYRKARIEFESGRKVTQCVTLHWLSRIGERHAIDSQHEAAAKAGRFQNFSLDSILSQSRIPAEKVQESGFTIKFPSLNIPRFGGSLSKPESL